MCELFVRVCFQSAPLLRLQLLSWLLPVPQAIAKCDVIVTSTVTDMVEPLSDKGYE